MQNTVTRLKPRRADYGVAVQAFLSGDFSFCVEALSFVEAPEAVALHARSLYRLERYAEALASLDRIDVGDLPHEYAAELLAVRGLNLMATRDPGANAVVTEARARAYSSGYKPVECEVETLAAFVAWSERNLDEAARCCQRVLDLGASATWFLGAERTDYVFNVGYWQSRCYDVLGVLSAVREEYAAQGDELGQSFVEYDKCGIVDVVVELRMLTNFAVLVRDLDSDAMAAFVEERAARVEWTAHTAHAEYTIFHAMGLNRAKRGDHLGAFRHLRRAAKCAPTIPLQIVSIIDKSFLSRELGELLSAQDDFEHAVNLAKQVDWERTIGTQRSALYELARQMAPIDVNQARSLWDRYASLKSVVSPLLLSGGDRRQRADECSAHAAVLAAEGQTSRAISLLLDSLEIWMEVGYRWRAAAVALDLAELTGEPRYYAIAESEAVKQPNSWLARRFAAMKVPAGV